MLYYAVFAKHSESSDHALFSEFDFDKTEISKNLKAQKILRRIFKAALRSSPENRTTSCNAFCEALSKLIKELEKPIKIVSEKPFENTFFIGREREIFETEKLFETSKIVIMTGLGGIGKSSAAREFLRKNEKNFDNIVWANFKNSLKETFASDNEFRVENLARAREETLSEYFERKLSAVRELVCETDSLLVIDNFEGGGEDLEKLLKTDLKLLLITRENALQSEFPSVKIGPLKDETLELFEHYSERKFDESEKALAQKIIEKVFSHTLTLKLLARQVKSRETALRDILELVENCGSFVVSDEKIPFVKDNSPKNETILSVIRSLFESSKLSPEQRKIFKTLALFSGSEIDAKRLHKMLCGEAQNSLSELCDLGWAEKFGEKISIHPVAAESVLSFEFNSEEADFSFKTMENLTAEIKKKQSFEAELYALSLAENVIKNSSRNDSLALAKPRCKLVYAAVMKMPRDNENFITRFSADLCEALENRKWRGIMRLYDYQIFIFCEKKDFQNAEILLKKAKNYAKKFGGDELWALYFDALASFYDARLDGAYHALSAEEKALFLKLQNAVDNCVKHAKRSDTAASRDCLLRHTLSKAAALIRGSPEKIGEINELLSEAETLVNAFTKPFSKNRCAYFLILAWYNTYVVFDKKMITKNIIAAGKISKKIYPEGLAFIEEFLIPSANILFESGRFSLAKKRLEIALKICEKRLEIAAFERMYNDLISHISDIENCRK